MSRIFVIETKNYEGWIYGSEKQKQWTQVIYKRKERFYNPIWQNYGHVQAIKDYMGMDLNDRSYFNIVVFTRRAELKFDASSILSASIVYPNQLKRLIEKESSKRISKVEVQRIVSALSALKNQDFKTTREIKKNHVKTIQEAKQAKPLPKKDCCPKCGSELSVKKGKYGMFNGCTNFPSCKYTKAV